MYIVLSNLPQGIKKREIRSLVTEYGIVKSVQRMGRKHSFQPEYLVDIQEENRMVIDQIVRLLNQRFWHQRILLAHAPLFQDNILTGKEGGNCQCKGLALICRLLCATSRVQG